jgi:hypothetical protein
MAGNPVLSHRPHVFLEQQESSSMRSPKPDGGCALPRKTTKHLRKGTSEFEQLLLAILNDDRAKVRALLEAKRGLATELLDHARLYQSSIVHWLYANDSALHLAAAGNRAEIAALLLAAGADPNSACNHRRGRPLHYAADGNVQRPAYSAAQHAKTIRCLLDAGAQIDAADKNGATALHRAVRGRCAAAVECLFNAGADPTARNHSGATPFHLATQNTGRGGTGADAAKAEQRKIIELMLAHGLSPTMKDARGKSVLDWATSEWVRELLAAGIV